MEFQLNHFFLEQMGEFVKGKFKVTKWEIEE